MTRKNIAYARFSTNNQRESSIDDQNRTMIRKYGELGIPESQITFLSDKAITGAHDVRPAYQEGMKAVEAGEVAIFMVEDQSRLTRDNDIEDLMKKCEFNGARLICVNDGFDSTVKGLKFAARAKGLVNNASNEDHADRVRRGIAGCALDVDGAAGDHTYGFRTEWKDPEAADKYFLNGVKGARPKRKVVVCEEEASILCQMFEWFVVLRWSLNKIARHLNEMKISTGNRSKSKVGWTAKLVSRRMANPKVIGLWTWGENRTVKYKNQRRNFKADGRDVVFIERPQLAIIPKELFEGAAKRFQEFKEVAGPNAGKSKRKKLGKYARLYPFNLLSGMLSCGECGISLHRGSGNGGNYYGCPKHAGNSGCGSKSSANKQRAEEAVISFIQEKLNKIDDWFDLVFAQVLRNIEAHDARIPEEKENLRRRKGELAKEIDVLAANLKLRVSQTLTDELSASEKALDEVNNALDAMERKQGVKRRLPTKAEVAAELSAMVALMAEDPARGSLLLRKIIGKGNIKVTDVIFPGKERGYAKLSFRFDPMRLLAAVYDKAGIVPPEGQSSRVEDVVLFTGEPTKMEKWLPQVHEWRLAGVTWKEIHERTGMSSSCLGAYLKRYRKTLPDSGAKGDVDSAIVDKEGADSTIVDDTE